jgi:O-antigen ligase
MAKAADTGRRLDLALAAAPAVLLPLAALAGGAEPRLAGHAFGALFLLLGLARLLLDGPERALTPLALACLPVALIATAGADGRWDRAAPELVALAAAGALVLLGRGAGRAQEGGALVLAAAQPGLALFALWALAVDLAGLEAHAPFAGHDESGSLAASFGAKNVAATWFGLSALVSAARLIALSRGGTRAPRRRDVLPAMAALGLALAALALTDSRAGIACAAFGMAVLLWLTLSPALLRVQPRTRRRLVALAAAAFLAATLATGQGALARAGSLAAAAEVRLDMYGVYLGLWLERPWLGWGLGAFNTASESVAELASGHLVDYHGAAHNLVVQWLVQGGIAGTLAMALAAAALNAPLLRRPREVEPALALAAGALALSHGLFDYGLELPAIVWLYATLLGLGIGAAERQRAPAPPAAAGQGPASAGS